MAKKNSRLKEFELRKAAGRRQREFMCGGDLPQRALPPNTLGPQEDVVENRRMNCRPVNVSPATANSTRRLLVENVLALILITGCIYGVYRLVIYILNA